MSEFIGFMQKYTDPNEFYKEAAKAQEDINDSIVDDLIEEVETANLVTCDCDLDCQPNTDNLKEWLSMYYELRRK